MFWHFPNGYCQQSAHLKNGYKLIYNHVYERPRLELYQLYDSQGKRVDWEEKIDLSQKLPELANSMNTELLEFLEGMDAGMTYYNPTCTRVKIPGANQLLSVIDEQRTNRRVRLRFKENGARVTRAQIIYTMNGDSSDSEWFPLEAQIISAKGKQPAKVEATLPPHVTHYVFNLIDENNFLISHPQMKKGDYPGAALKVVR